MFSFNIYQFDASGQVGVDQINDISIMFSGTYFPVNPSVAFLTSLLGDARDRPPSFYIKQSGVVGGIPQDAHNLSIIITGDVAPGYIDNQNFYVNQSGAVSGIMIDVPLFSVGVSGSWVSINGDAGNFYTNNSGDITEINLITTSNDTTFSGTFIGISYELNNFYTNLSGSIIPAYGENSDYNLVISSISYVPGEQQINIYTEDQENITFGIATISYVPE